MSGYLELIGIVNRPLMTRTNVCILIDYDLTMINQERVVIIIVLVKKILLSKNR